MHAPMTAANTVFSKYATFFGRATRSEFWWWALCVVTILLIARAIDAAILEPMLGLDASPQNPSRPLTSLLAFALLLPNIALAARRLHDIGKSAWWLLVGFVPIVGAFILVYFYIQPSAPKANQYGPFVPFPA